MQTRTKRPAAMQGNGNNRPTALDQLTELARQGEFITIQTPVRLSLYDWTEVARVSVKYGVTPTDVIQAWMMEGEGCSDDIYLEAMKRLGIRIGKEVER